jgi:acyl carrier protein
MTEQQILDALAVAIAEEIGAKGVIVTRDTQAADIGGWDSMGHGRIIANLEDALGVELDMDRAFAIANVGELVDLVREAIIARA